MNGQWEPDEPNADAFRKWIRDAWQQLRPFSTGGNYINFQTADEDQAPANAYGKNYERLRRAKAEYDPRPIFSASTATSHRRPESSAGLLRAQPAD